MFNKPIVLCCNYKPLYDVQLVCNFCFNLTFQNWDTYHIQEYVAIRPFITKNPPGSFAFPPLLPTTRVEQ
jgi:hypothetical protein